MCFWNVIVGSSLTALSTNLQNGSIVWVHYPPLHSTYTHGLSDCPMAGVPCYVLRDRDGSVPVLQCFNGGHAHTGMCRYTVTTGIVNIPLWYVFTIHNFPSALHVIPFRNHSTVSPSAITFHTDFPSSVDVITLHHYFTYYTIHCFRDYGMLSQMLSSTLR